MSPARSGPLLCWKQPAVIFDGIIQGDTHAFERLSTEPAITQASGCRTWLRL